MTTAVLTQQIQEEITRISLNNSVNAKLLEEFAYFILNNKSLKSPSKKLKDSLSLNDIKKAIYWRFKVQNTNELRKSGSFKMATDGMEKLDFRYKKTWEMLYRKFIGILPNEVNQNDYGCINGINIFEYFKPWQVFNLNPKIATKEDIKKAYRQLSKIYHPDNQETGDRKIFERLELMYRSLIAEG